LRYGKSSTEHAGSILWIIRLGLVPTAASRGHAWWWHQVVLGARAEAALVEGERGLGRIVEVVDCVDRSQFGWRLLLVAGIGRGAAAAMAAQRGAQGSPGSRNWSQGKVAEDA
jgi:hypothetical protein